MNGDDSDVPHEPSAMDMFLEEVGSIKEMINYIGSQALSKIKKLHEKSKKATKTSTVKKIREQMRVEMASVSKQAGDAKKRIQQLHDDTDESGAAADDVYGVSDVMFSLWSHPTHRTMCRMSWWEGQRRWEVYRWDK